MCVFLYLTSPGTGSPIPAYIGATVRFGPLQMV